VRYEAAPARWQARPRRIWISLKTPTRREEIAPRARRGTTISFAACGRQRQIEAVYLLGARVVDELIDQIARHHDLREDIDRRLAMYAAFAPVAVAVAHGDKFAPPPLRVVGDGG